MKKNIYKKKIIGKGIFNNQSKTSNLYNTINISIKTKNYLLNIFLKLIMMKQKVSSQNNKKFLTPHKAKNNKINIIKCLKILNNLLKTIMIFKILIKI